MRTYQIIYESSKERSLIFYGTLVVEPHKHPDRDALRGAHVYARAREKAFVALFYDPTL